MRSPSFCLLLVFTTAIPFCCCSFQQSLDHESLGSLSYSYSMLGDLLEQDSPSLSFSFSTPSGSLMSLSSFASFSIFNCEYDCYYGNEEDNQQPSSEPSIFPTAIPSEIMSIFASHSPTDRKVDASSFAPIGENFHVEIDFPSLHPSVLPVSSTIFTAFPSMAPTISDSTSRPTIQKSTQNMPVELSFQCQFTITNLTDAFVSKTDLVLIAHTTAAVLNLTENEVKNSTWAPLRRLSEEEIIATITTTHQIAVIVETGEDSNERYDELSLALDKAVMATGFYTLVLREYATTFHSAALDYATTIDVKVGPPNMKPQIIKTGYSSSLTTDEVIAITIGCCTFLLMCVFCVVYSSKLNLFQQEKKKGVDIEQLTESKTEIYI